MTNNELSNGDGLDSVTPEEQEVKEQSIQDDFFIDYEEIDNDKLKSLKEPRVVPSSNSKDIRATMKQFKKEDVSSLTDDEKVSLTLANESKDFINDDDMGLKKKNESILNKINVADKDLYLKSLILNKRAKTANSALLKLSQKVGIGTLEHIPLWNSGFWVTVKPLDDEEIINLEFDIINELARVGKKTNTLVFSNQSVLFADVILKHFKLKLHDTSLKLDDSDDINNYISIYDIPTIALGLIKTKYSHGFNAIIPCKNTIVLDDKKHPLCSNKINIKLDLGELLWVDESLLTKDHKSLMLKRTPNSVSIEEVIKYQETLPVAGEIEKTFTHDEDEVKVILSTPNASRYLEFGRNFITVLREKANELVRTNPDIEDQEAAENLLAGTLYLQLYVHFIKGVPIDDVVITNVTDVNESLSLISSNYDLSKEIMEFIKDYANQSTITTIGVPNFVCNKCNHKQTEKEIIPLAVYEYFFTLLHSKYEKVMEKLNKR